MKRVMVPTLIMFVTMSVLYGNTIKDMIQAGNLDTLKQLPVTKVLAFHKKHDGSALHLAIKYNKLKIVQYLVNHGANIEYSSEQGLTPLELACHVGNIEIVKYLIANKALVNNSKGYSYPLIIAAKNKNYDIVEILLKNGAKKNVFTFILLGKKWGADINKLRKYFKEHPELIKKVDSQGNTLLHWATLGGDQDIIKFFLDFGIDVNSINNEQETPLHVAVQGKNEKAVSLLLKYGAQTEAKDGIGNVALMYTACEGNITIAKQLLDKGAKINQYDKLGFTPLSVAVLNGKLPMAKYLLENGAQPNVINKKGKFPLLFAVKNNNPEIAALLLKHGAKVDLTDANGFTALVYAITKKNPAMVKLLLKYGADPNKFNPEQEMTPLMYAVTLNKAPDAMMEALAAAAGSKINIKNKVGLDALLFACVYKHFGYAEILLAHGADPNVKDENGTPPLVPAIWDKNYPAIAMLLKYKANPNACIKPLAKKLSEQDKQFKLKNCKGEIPLLCLAVALNEAQAVELLLKYGADINMTGLDSYTSLDLAIEGKLTDMIKLLKQHGARTTAELKKQEK